MSGPMLPRRRFLGLAGGAGVLLAAGFAGPQLLDSTPQTGQLLRSQARLPRPFQVPLPLPPVLAPAARDGDVDRYEITQRESEVEILPGLRTRIWGYEGMFPGPTIESRRGRATTVRHHNRLPVPTVVHLHGGRTPSDSDGYPTDLVLPAGSSGVQHQMHDPAAVVSHGARDYTFPLNQRAATLWYHDHRMDFTGPAVWRGLAGFHLVRDDEEDALGLPAGERELPLMLTDRSFAADGALRYPMVDPSLTGEHGVTEPYRAGVFGDVILVNGAPWPVHEVSNTRHRLRILNASNARRYEIALDPPPPGGRGLLQIGADQGLLEAPLAHDTVRVAPAERYDLIVDFGRYAVGTEVTLVNRLGDGPTALIMRFRITHNAREGSLIPTRLSHIDPLRREDATVTREFDFRAGRVNGQHGWRIGGEPFSPTRIDARPRLGTTEIWRFVTDLHHPIHLHLVNFRVLARGNRPPDPLDGGLKDTVDLRPSEAVEVLTRFDGYRGRYVFHCHNLEHEDMGMMANFETS